MGVSGVVRCGWRDAEVESVDGRALWRGGVAVGGGRREVVACRVGRAIRGKLGGGVGGAHIVRLYLR